MGTSLNGETRRFSGVYVIYSADVVGSERDIERMSPASHLPAGYNGYRKRAGEVVASRFELTEGDSEYDFGYLAEEGAGAAYLPAADEPDDNDNPGAYLGRHRKWVAELTRAEWVIFADRYIIDLDGNGYPERYEDTMGSLTEFGHLFAVAVDNSEGWQDANGPQWVDSQFYVSFATPEDSEPELAPGVPEPGTPEADAYMAAQGYEPAGDGQYRPKGS